MREMPKNPGIFAPISLSTYSFSASSGSAITTTAQTLKTGDEIILHINTGSTAELTDYGQYFAIVISTTSIKLAATAEQAQLNQPITITGNIGAGTIYPCVEIGGAAVYVGTTGNINVVGWEMPTDTSGYASNAVLIKNIAAGLVQPMRYRKVYTYQTTASDLVAML